MASIVGKGREVGVVRKAVLLLGSFVAGAVLLAVALCVNTTSAFAEEAALSDSLSSDIALTEEEAKAEGWKFEIFNSGATEPYTQILDYRGYDDLPVVPASIGDCKVTHVVIWSLCEQMDFSYCTNLENLSCPYVGFSTLDLSNNADLEVLNCSRNKLTSLDLSNNPKLRELDCDYNNISELKLPANLDAVTRIVCNNNAIADTSVLEKWASDHPNAVAHFESQTVSSEGSGSGSSSQPAAKPQLLEYSGYDRYDAARYMLAAALDNDVCKGAIVVSGEDGKFADALAASALSGLLDYPVILTNGSWLNYEARECLKWLSNSYSGMLDILIVGGSSTVTQDVADALGSYGWVTRLSGADRYELAERVYQYGEQHGGWNDERIIVTKGNDFPDALTIAPYATSFKTPILLVDQNSAYLNTDQREMLSKHNDAVVLGGVNSVSPMLYADIDASTPGGAIRLDGADRYEASRSIVEWELQNGMQLDGVGFATGEKFADALSSGFLLSQTNSVLLLVNGTNDSANNGTYQYLSAHNDGITSAKILGGPASVIQTVRNNLVGALGW